MMAVQNFLLLDGNGESNPCVIWYGVDFATRQIFLHIFIGIYNYIFSVSDLLQALLDCLQQQLLVFLLGGKSGDSSSCKDRVLR